jgi:hypothetical protein
MPRGNSNGEIGIEQMADNAAAEKSGAAKYSHASRTHSAKVPRRLRPSYSHYSSSNRPKQAPTGAQAIVATTKRSGVISVGNSWI